MAVLRSRLFDIDVLINRTLVYGCLTVTLVLVYFGGVVLAAEDLRVPDRWGLPVHGRRFDPGDSSAVRTRFRHRIQDFIDRRFYRRKYDAARTLSVFSARLRDETDLEQLNTELLAIVRTTMQPEHASLWLREREIET